MGSPMAQRVKNLPAMQETQEMWVWSLDWEDPLEKEMAIHSSILAWKMPWTQEPVGLQDKFASNDSLRKTDKTYQWFSYLFIYLYSTNFQNELRQNKKVQNQ